MMEDNTTHTTTRGGQTGLLDTDNTRIEGIVSREIATERQPVAGDAGMVATVLVGHLCRTRLSCHLEEW